MNYSKKPMEYGSVGYSQVISSAGSAQVEFDIRTTQSEIEKPPHLKQATLAIQEELNNQFSLIRSLDSSINKLSPIPREAHPDEGKSEERFGHLDELNHIYWQLRDRNAELDTLLKHIKTLIG
jgi:hypothetical protein